MNDEILIILNMHGQTFDLDREADAQFKWMVNKEFSIWTVKLVLGEH